MQPDCIELPQNTTSDQLRSVDRGLEEAHAQRHQAVNDAAAEWITIDCRVNGHVIPWEFNIGQFRRFLGLPAFPLIDPYRPAIHMPLHHDSNILDEDHAPSDDGEWH